MCVVFLSPDTKDALSSVQKTLLLFIFCVQEREREAGAFLVRRASRPGDFTSDNLSMASGLAKSGHLRRFIQLQNIGRTND
jgi:hypothetical protein